MVSFVAQPGVVAGRAAAVWRRAPAPVPLNSPAIFSIPLSFVTLIIISLLTKKRQAEPTAP
jgi:Na+(H+)/acetate symporter ActP